MVNEVYGSFIDELKALADTTRMRIVSLLWEGGDLCSCEIEHILDIRQSNASRHMRRLREAGLVDHYKKAQWSHYTIAGTHRIRDGYFASLIDAARSREPALAEDIARLEDYRSRGFSCATIHEWIPFQL